MATLCGSMRCRCFTLKWFVANSPHPTHDAARPFGNRQGPTHSCWSRRRVFGRTPQLQGVPRKTVNPQNAVSSTATVAHKTVRVLQWARMKQGDALKTLKCSLRTNARNVQRPPTVSNPRPERQVRCATFSQRWHKWHERIGLRIAAHNQA